MTLSTKILITLSVTTVASIGVWSYTKKREVEQARLRRHRKKTQEGQKKTGT